jgi:hypothetical protein
LITSYLTTLTFGRSRFTQNGIQGHHVNRLADEVILSSL